MKLNCLCLMVATLLTMHIPYILSVNATESNQANQSKIEAIVEEDAIVLFII